MTSVSIENKHRTLGRPDIRLVFKDEGFQTFALEHAMARVAGLPMEAADALRCPDAMHIISSILNLESARTELRNTLSEELYQRIGNLGDEQARFTLIHLRRDIFNDRTVQLTPQLLAILQGVAPCSVNSVRKWISDAEEYKTLFDKGPATLESEMKVNRERVKTELRNGRFRNALRLASPTFDLNLENYLRSLGAPANRRLRLAERTALLYLYRAACKTSPFSTFTLITNVVLGSDDQMSRSIDHLNSAAQIKCQPTINIGVLTHLFHQIIETPEIAIKLKVRITSAWSREGSNIRYLRKQVSIWRRQGPVETSTTQELFYLPYSALIQRVIESLGTGEKVLRQIAEELTESTGLDESDIHQFLFLLIHHGFLLALAPRLSLDQADPLAEFCSNITAIRSKELAPVADSLEIVRTTLAVHDCSDATSRVQALSSLRDVLVCSYEALKLPSSLVPKTLFYEDAALVPSSEPSHLPCLSGPLEDLAIFQQLLPIFDRAYGLRLAMKGYFVQRHGQGARVDDVLSFAMQFGTEYHARYWDYQWAQFGKSPQDRAIVTDNHFHVKQLELIEDARAALKSYIGQQIAARGSSSAIDFGRAELLAIASRLPKRELVSNSFFVQIMNFNDVSSLVLNKVYLGLAHMFSRFLPLLSSVPNTDLLFRLRRMVSLLQTENTIFAEIRGGVDTNLDIHPSICEYEIRFPGEAMSVQSAKHIGLEDLYIQHDADSDTLSVRSRTLQRRIVPVYHGFLLPPALPLLQQVLLNFSDIFIGDYSFSGLHQGPDTETLSTVPRFTIGSLVIERAKWILPRSKLPLKAETQSAFDFMVAVTRWRKELHLPDRVFIRSTSPESNDGAQDNQDLEDRNAFNSKPFYVDFHSAFSISLLERVISKLAASQNLIVTEMLPSPDQFWLRNASESHVSEIVLELTQMGIST